MKVKDFLVTIFIEIDSIVSFFLEHYADFRKILQLFFIFGNCCSVAGSLKKEAQKKMERKEVRKCDMIAKGLQKFKAQNRARMKTWLQKPTDSCVQGKSAGLQKYKEVT